MPEQSLVTDNDPMQTLARLREGLVLANKRKARWFFIIAGLSLVNSVLIVAGVKWSFPFGLGIAQTLDAVIAFPDPDATTGHVISITAFAVMANLMAITVYVGIGMFAWIGYRWAYRIGMILYGLDAWLATYTFVGLFFHVILLHVFYTGLKAAKMLRAMDSAGVLPSSDGGRPQIVLPAVRHANNAFIPDIYARIAGNLGNQFAAQRESRHEIIEVDLNNFRHLDLAWYGQARVALEGLGFRHVADIEDCTEVASNRKVVHPLASMYMTSIDGAVMVAVERLRFRLNYSLAVRLKGKSANRSVILTTEFSDSVLIHTDNVKDWPQFDRPPHVHCEYHPSKTPIQSLYERHLARVREHLAANPGVQPLVTAGREDLIAAIHRRNAAEAQWRTNMGVSLSEIERIMLGRKDKAACIYYALHQETTSPANR